LVFVTFITHSGGSISSITVTDSNSNTYNQISSNSNATGDAAYCFAATGIASGSNTITVNFGPNAGYYDIVSSEYSGVSSVDSHTASSHGTGTSLSSGSMTTSAATELLVCYGVSTSNATLTATSSFSSVVSDGSVWDGNVENLLESSTGSYTGTFSCGTSGSWYALMVGLE
jgi:hypothetical protein